MDTVRLGAIPVFDGLADTDLAEWASKFQTAEILQGDALTKEGEFAYKFFIVLEGEVEVLRDFDSVAKLGTGEFFGEMGLMGAERRNARVVAHSRCEVAWMMAWDFTEMTERYPDVAARIDAKVAERTPRD